VLTTASTAPRFRIGRFLAESGRKSKLHAARAGPDCVACVSVGAPLTEA
jgi:hypothetical protein